MLAKPRPDTNDITNAAVIDECFKAIAPANFAVIFNNADKKFDKKKAIRYFKKCSDGAGGNFPLLT